ncbi:MAG TPA: LamG domain-containing protein [Polyangia bacterium]|nr:LamG domain-containing protein [Polyangia bacterium]
MPSGRALLWALALTGLACQPSSGVSVRDAAVEQPSFDVPPLDGATAGYALSFDGVRQYATAGDAGFLPVGGPMTIELWVNYAAATNTQDFIALRTSVANGSESGVQIGIHAGVLAVWRVFVDRVLVQAATNPAAGTWHHVAYTFDTTTNVFYVDGVAVDSNTNPTDTHTPGSAWLGTRDGYTNLFKGQLDEVRVWAVTRSASQIVTDMQHSSGQGETGLVAYWTFDDVGDVGRSVDLSGHGNDVTFGDGVAELMPLRVPSDIPFGS